ncbi:hypothetical protein OAK19_00365 [Aureispira]|nr:hypothetical protein [Aureispira sp.]
MSCFLKWFFLSLLVVFISAISYSQKQILEKTEIAYGLTEQDSIVRYRKNTIYDIMGREISKKNFFYHSKLKGVLIKEERSYFNEEDQVLTEEVITYPAGKEPESKKMVTKYLDYAVKEEKSKRIYRKLYDDYREILREDTLNYDINNNLIGCCNYDYRGNTSLFCHYYNYNKKGLLKRWRTYFKWTTIDGRGEVVSRKAKRRDARMHYNKRGQLACSKERYYLNLYIRKIKHDKSGKVLIDKLLRRIKTSRTPTKEDRKKYDVDLEKQVINYENGLPVSDVKYLNNIEIKKKSWEYDGIHPIAITTSQDGFLVEQNQIQYNAEGIKTKKIKTKYTKNGLLRYSLITLYDQSGKPIIEKQLSGKKVLSLLEMKYDKEGNKTLNSLSFNNRNSYEKTMFTYRYH